MRFREQLLDRLLSKHKHIARSNKSSNSEIDEIIFELEQCREDERAAHNQIVQVVLAAATVLAIIFAIYGSNNNSDEIQMKSYLIVPLVITMLSAASSFIATIGLLCSLRHHYVKDLEKRLFELSRSEKKILHWETISSYIKTLNAKHISSIVPAAFFANYISALISAAVLCILFVSIFSDFIDKRVTLISFLIWIPFLGIVIFSILYGTQNSKEFYKASVSNASKNLLSDHSPNSKEKISSAFLYFVLPRPTDLQKTLFLVFGIAIGSCFSGSTQSIPNFLYAIIVLELLTYQARYQWNDVRGIKEDQFKSRLPVRVLGYKVSVTLSVITALYKVAVAIAMTYLAPSAIKQVLWIAMISIFVLGAFYELARSKQSVFWVFSLIPYGYVLRFLTGVWLVLPNLFHMLFGYFGIMQIVILLVFVSIMFYGNVFVSLNGIGG